MQTGAVWPDPYKTGCCGLGAWAMNLLLLPFAVKSSRYIRLHMPRGGEDGVIVATRDDSVRVEFRGRPYSLWDIGEDTPMTHLHSSFLRINISNLHCNETETVTPWHDEWEIVAAMFNTALQAVDICAATKWFAEGTFADTNVVLPEPLV